MKWKVYVTQRTNEAFFDTYDDEYDGVLYDSMSEALVVKSIALTNPKVEYAFVKAIDD